MGILAALVERGVSGQGQVVDAAMVDGAALRMAPLFGAWASGFWNEERGTNLLDSGAPFYDVYECSDGRWLAIGAIEAQFYALLLEGLGLAGDPTLPDQNDSSRWPELHDRIAAVVRTRTRDDWAAHFADGDACVAPVLTMGEAPTHPHAVARGAFADVEGVPQPAPAPRFGRTPAGAPTVAVEGADAAQVLADWGVDAATVERLRASGAVT
jgi:alpha-methylacyl-CoA racemase